jgi:uncharacterized protein (TIGR02246 family)
VRTLRAFRLRLPLAAALFVLVWSPAPAAKAASALSTEDQAKVRGILEAYRSAWLANDADAVLRLFAEDAVLMPHHGVEPVVGKQAARAFWFPGGPPTTITAFTLTIDQIDGGCEVAYVRGRSKIEWTTGTGPEAKRSANAGTNLTVLRRQKDGSWRVAVMMWDDPPPR